MDAVAETGAGEPQEQEEVKKEEKIVEVVLSNDEVLTTMETIVVAAVAATTSSSTISSSSSPTPLVASSSATTVTITSTPPLSAAIQQPIPMRSPSFYERLRSYFPGSASSPTLNTITDASTQTVTTTTATTTTASQPLAVPPNQSLERRTPSPVADQSTVLLASTPPSSPSLARATTNKGKADKVILVDFTHLTTYKGDENLKSPMKTSSSGFLSIFSSGRSGTKGAIQINFRTVFEEVIFSPAFLT